MKAALPRRTWLQAASVLAVATWLSGCSTAPSATLSPAAHDAWTGRMAVQVQSASVLDTQSNSFSAGFELQGNPQQGSLQLFTPLGSSVARITWNPQGAELEQSGTRRPSASLDTLVQETLGTAIPIDALFQWLKGHAAAPSGWQVDLSRYTDGRISAQRDYPLPQAQLRVVLDL